MNGAERVDLTTAEGQMSELFRRVREYPFALPYGNEYTHSRHNRHFYVNEGFDWRTRWFVDEHGISFLETRMMRAADTDEESIFRWTSGEASDSDVPRHGDDTCVAGSAFDRYVAASVEGINAQLRADADAANEDGIGMDDEPRFDNDDLIHMAAMVGFDFESGLLDGDVELAFDVADLCSEIPFGVVWEADSIDREVFLTYLCHEGLYDYDDEGYSNYSGLNVDGLTREQAALAAEHGIDAELLLSIAEGEVSR
jgi:hypothetical protein